MSNNNLFVKLTNPQLLNLEKVLKEGVVVFIALFIITLIFNDYFYHAFKVFRMFDWYFLSALIASFFFGFIPYVAIRWNITSYLIFRKQIINKKL